MQLLLSKKERKNIEFALVYGGIALLLLVAARFLPVTQLAPDCVFRSLTGLPCPTCGSTRAVAFFAQGHLLAAFRMNPAMTAVITAALAAFLLRVLSLAFDLPGMSVGLTDREKDLLRLSAVLALLLNWVYLITSV